MIWALGIVLFIGGFLLHTQSIHAVFPYFVGGAGGVILLIKIFAP